MADKEPTREQQLEQHARHLDAELRQSEQLLGRQTRQVAALSDQVAQLQHALEHAQGRIAELEDAGQKPAPKPAPKAASKRNPRGGQK